MTFHQRWYWARDVITLIIKSAFCTFGTVAKFVLEVCVSVNLAHVKEIQNKAANFWTEFVF